MTSGPSRPVRPFTVGVSVDQIMQACHWKAHNTFTNFYLKDLTWSDTDNDMYLGPVVAAQQVLDPSPQISCPRGKKRGGAHPLQPSLQESLPGSRYSFPFKMLRVRSFLFFSYQVTSIKDLFSRHQSHIQVVKIYEMSNHGLVSH